MKNLVKYLKIIILKLDHSFMIKKHVHLSNITVLNDIYFENNIILLPLHPLIDKKDVDYIVDFIKSI